jgi:ribonuclease E
VNSGKSTREFSIEETALQTNLEAAEEVARQVKLRDLAGLIVIDFIDMEERRNNRRVESRLKDALRHDRARIQVGRISHFGLLEMSRQRLRTGVTEGSTTQCPHCQGTGIVRSTESVALAVLRALEDHLARDSRSSLTTVTTPEVALYILNNKRTFITEMEHRYGISIAVEAGERMQGANFAIEKSAAPAASPKAAERSSAVNMEWAFESEAEEEAADSGQGAEEAEAHGETEADERRPRRRRRRGRREDRGERRGEPVRSADDGNGHGEVHAEGGLIGQAHGEGSYEQGDPGDQGAEATAEIPGLGEQPQAPLDEDERRGRRRRRGRRGGRRGRDRGEADHDGEGAPSADAGAHADMAETADVGVTIADTGAPEEAEAAEPAIERSVTEPAEGPWPEPQAERAPEPVEAASGGEPETKAQPAAEPAPPAVVEPTRGPEPPPPAVEAPAADTARAVAVEPDPVPSDPLKPARKGWWQRRATVE